jgi:orotate phosphoribosyltransferase
MLEHGERPQAVGGITLGADPIVTAVSLTSALRGWPVPAFIIRKEPKKHGTAQWIEGTKNLRPGMRVAILEDVVTTGASTLRAVERAVESGLVVARVLCIVDRNEGGADAVAGTGYRIEPMFLKEDVENA